MPIKTTWFWGKKQGDTDVTHPLAHHCLEVAAVLQALLTSNIIRHRLAQSAGLEDLTPRHIKRLAALAALHDAGKCHHGFQEQNGSWQTHGHVREIFQLLFDHPRQVEGYNALDLNTVASWFQDEEQLMHWLWALFCHHGRPLTGDASIAGKPASHELQSVHPNVWNANALRNPLAGLQEMIQAIRHTFPDAFVTEDNPKDRLPITPLMQHLFTGLLTLADWIGSDTHYFPFADTTTLPSYQELEHKAKQATLAVGCDVTAARHVLAAQSIDFQHIFNLPTPNSMQREMGNLSLAPAGNLVILESETGSGKTEAALLHFLNLFRAELVDGLYFALPTRAAAVQIHRRVVQAMQKAFGPDHPPVVLAVPGYLQVDEMEGRKLAQFTILWPDDLTDRQRNRGWAAEHPKRFLAAPIAVGTVDQILLSALSTRHAHMRAAALSRLLLVVDEVHASDAFMTTILQEVVARHTAIGGETLLMSATLGASVRTLFLHGPRVPPPPPHEAATTPYPLLSHRCFEPDQKSIPMDRAGKQVRITQIPQADDPEAVTTLALTAARSGARVLVIRNTVQWAIATQKSMENQAATMPGLLLQCAGIAAPHHSRYAFNDRKLLDTAIEARFGKGILPPGGVVATSTQTIEQSLDIDADLLITDLCPMDVLLQRIGRLHRHHRNDRPIPYREPQVFLLTPRDGLEAHLNAKGTVSSTAKGHGWGSVYQDMRMLAATLEALPSPAIITIPADNRRLVEAATHPDNLQALANTKGAAWQHHGTSVFGTTAAHKNSARHGIYLRDKWLHECKFFELKEEQITTRLGLHDRLVPFNPTPMGPFGLPISLLTIPGRWLTPQPAPDALPSEITPEPGGFCFTFCNARFRYDRLGLRPVTQEERIP
ncbi:MAG: CRISPR-associated helicase Cas3' [Magnetococcus sp. YQC-5]